MEIVYAAFVATSLTVQTIEIGLVALARIVSRACNRLSLSIFAVDEQTTFFYDFTLILYNT